MAIKSAAAEKRGIQNEQLTESIGSSHPRYAIGSAGGNRSDHL